MGYQMEQVRVTLKHDNIHADDCLECETKSGKIDLIITEIRSNRGYGPRNPAKIVDITEKCPVHKTLHSEVIIESHQKK